MNFPCFQAGELMNDLDHNFETIVENIYDGLYIVDINRKITYWNAAAELITGYAKDEVIGHTCADNILIHVDDKGCDLCMGACPLSAVITDGASRKADVFLHHKDGHRVSVSVRVTPLKNAEGNIIGGIELFSESNSHILLQQKIAELEKLALVDHLSQLPNRRQLHLELAAQCAMCKRAQEYSFGILYFDLDHFKRINDEEGHDIGDKSLQIVAKTIASSIRPFDTVGRWGGEEFLGIFPNITREKLCILAERLLTLVRKSIIETPHGPIHVTMSIGGLIARETQDVDILIKRVDVLMYQSKQSGRNQATIA
jgi:diguanylate cyclase (GGDEF)-like protein/PAS domain S-box-containing protein